MLLSVKIPLNIPIVSIGICPITVNIYSNIPRFHIDFPVLPLKHLCFNQIKMIPIQYTHHMPSLIAGPPIGVRSYIRQLFSSSGEEAGSLAMNRQLWVPPFIIHRFSRTIHLGVPFQENPHHSFFSSSS